jgi:hypothetical protein
LMDKFTLLLLLPRTKPSLFKFVSRLSIAVWDSSLLNFQQIKIDLMHCSLLQLTKSAWH